MKQTTPNPLLEDLTSFGNNIGLNKFLTYQMKNHLQDYRSILIDRWKSHANRKQTIMATTMVIGDLTGNSDQGWKINFPTDYHFMMNISEIHPKIEILIEREALRNLAHSYEALEKYLFDIIATYLFTNVSQLRTVINKIKPKEETLESFREAIRNLRGRNSAELFKLLRTLAPSFAEAETTNHEAIDLKDWFEVLSLVRHGIVHSNFTVKKSLRYELTPQQKKILTRYFPHLETETAYILQMKYSDVDGQFDLILEYGIQVFKHLSIQKGYHWKVYKYMSGEPLARQLAENFTN
ncbi:MAG: hypothetical protein U0U09_00100 [Cyclobacteriaceae bacterium]